MQLLPSPQVFYKRGDVPDLRPYEVKLIETKYALSLVGKWCWGLCKGSCSAILLDTPVSQV